MYSQTPLNEILGNEIRVKILRVLFAYDGAFTGRHIARLSRVEQSVVQKHLQKLVSAGIISARAVGRSKTYAINRDNVMRVALVRLFKEEGGLASRLSDAIVKLIKGNPFLAQEVRHVSLYGSALRRGASAEDIDVFVICRDSGDEHEVEAAFHDHDLDISKAFATRLHAYTICAGDSSNPEHASVLQSVKRDSVHVYGEKLEKVVSP